MNRFIFLFVLLAVASCGTQKAMPIESAKDSVSVIIKESVIYKDTTIYVEVPKEAENAILPDIDTSRLETSVAKSEAWVANGKLNHILRNKADVVLPKIISVPIYLISAESKQINSAVLVKEVEKPLNNWQIFRMMTGTLVLIAIGVWILLKILKGLLVK